MSAWEWLRGFFAELLRALSSSSGGAGSNADGHPPPEAEDSPPSPVPSEEFVVAPGKQIFSEDVQLPATVSFFVTPTRMDVWAPDVKACVVWAYSGEFTGGREAKRAEWALRTYKVKAMWGGGAFSEPRYAPPWASGKRTHVQVRLDRDRQVVLFDGVPAVETRGKLPKIVRVEIGDPSVRPGVWGAVVSGFGLS